MYTLAEGVRACGVDLTMMYLGNLRSPRGLFTARRKVIRLASQYDLVHAQYGSACAVATAGIRTVPTVVSLRGSDWHRFSGRPLSRSLHSALATWMTRMVLARFDLVVPVSHRIAGEAEKLNPRVCVLPSPIDLTLFKPVEKLTARRTLGNERDDRGWVLFTTVSENNPVKRLELARQTIARANKCGNRFVLRVATDLDREYMPVFVGSCDVVLCTSTHEGWPNSVKEALACNLPFVATDVSDLSSIAANEPGCAICDPDPDKLADAIRTAVEKSTGEIALRHYVEKMSVEAVSYRLVQKYEEIAGV